MKENKCDCGCINTEHIKLANKLTKYKINIKTMSQINAEGNKN